MSHVGDVTYKCRRVFYSSRITILWPTTQFTLPQSFYFEFRILVRGFLIPKPIAFMAFYSSFALDKCSLKPLFSNLPIYCPLLSQLTHNSNETREALTIPILTPIISNCPITQLITHLISNSNRTSCHRQRKDHDHTTCQDRKQIPSLGIITWFSKKAIQSWWPGPNWLAWSTTNAGIVIRRYISPPGPFRSNPIWRINV